MKTKLAVIDLGGMEEKYRFKYSSGLTVKFQTGSVELFCPYPMLIVVVSEK